MTATDRLVLHNGTQSITFVPTGAGYRPEWFREGDRPMLRFKDHEWLNISAMRITEGMLHANTPTACEFGDTITFAGTAVAWSVRVALPPDGGAGFQVTTQLTPIDEAIEILEGLSTFELPYEYDKDFHSMVVMGQQPVYRQEEGQELSGAGYTHPNWYYGRAGHAQLTYPCASPLFTHRMANPDGSNARWTMVLGNWLHTSVKDMFAQPTRRLSERPGDIVFPDPALQMAPGRCGMKYLIGAVNWNNSLHKDPNVLVDPGVGVHQEVIVDFAGAPRGGAWDSWLAGGWERLARLHFPLDGCVPAYEVAVSRGASWIDAADWLAESLVLPEGRPGFFYPDRGPSVYSPGTRPVWDYGVKLFAGQFAGPVTYLGLLYHNDAYVEAGKRLETIFCSDPVPALGQAQQLWTIGPTPLYTGIIRRGLLVDLAPDTLARVQTYFTNRAEFLLNPPAGARKGDAGIFAWDAFANLLCANLFERERCEQAALELLARVNAKLDADFWTFNCAEEGNLVGAGQARPFGHGIAIAANMLAWQRFGDARYLEAAQRFANLLLAMHFITYNESPAPDLDTRGWTLGSTGGRDQWAQLPPWETEMAMQQFAPLLQAQQARAGIYDVMWLHSHTGLAQFPKARSMKRLYTTDMSITYRPIDSLASERAFYLALPYASYENPWDQTMLAAYQSVEPLILAPFYGGALVHAADTRILAVVPAAATYDPTVADRFTTELWNPLDAPITTTLVATLAARRGVSMRYHGAITGALTADAPHTLPLTIPPREVVRVTFEVVG